MKKIICLYGGPGSGKSTTAAGLFYRLKCEGFNAEMNREYVKEWAWEGREIKPGDQTYYFAKMARKERIYMEAGIDVIITDSPLILTHFYGMKFDEFEQKANTSLVMLKHHHEICKHYGYKIEHFIINRNKPYNPKGRYQDEETAKSFDSEIKQLLLDKNIKFTEIYGVNPDNIVQTIIDRINGVQEKPSLTSFFENAYKK